jgi:ProP effector
MLSGQTLTLKKPLSLEKQAQMSRSSDQKPVDTPVKEKDKNAQKMKWEERVKRGKETMDWLLHAFPQCFNLKAPLPLKIGIGKEVMEKWVYLSSLPYDSKIPARTAIRTAIGWYVRRDLYLAAFETATHRIDLDGKEAGEITEAEKEYARERLEALKERYKAKKAE